jgi:hypothetical protein
LGKVEVDDEILEQVVVDIFVVIVVVDEPDVDFVVDSD